MGRCHRKIQNIEPSELSIVVVLDEAGPIERGGSLARSKAEDLSGGVVVCGKGDCERVKEGEGGCENRRVASAIGALPSTLVRASRPPLLALPLLLPLRFLCCSSRRENLRSQDGSWGSELRDLSGVRRGG